MKSLESIRRFRASQFDMIKAGLKAEGEVISVNMSYTEAGTPSPTLGLCDELATIRGRSCLILGCQQLQIRIAEEWAPASRNMTSSHHCTTKTSSNPWWELLEEAIQRAGGRLKKPEIFPASTDSRYFRQKEYLHLDLKFEFLQFLKRDVYLKGIEMYESYASYVDNGGGNGESKF